MLRVITVKQLTSLRFEYGIFLSVACRTSYDQLICRSTLKKNQHLINNCPQSRMEGERITAKRRLPIPIRLAPSRAVTVTPFGSVQFGYYSNFGSATAFLISLLHIAASQCGCATGYQRFSHVCMSARTSHGLCTHFITGACPIVRDVLIA